LQFQHLVVRQFLLQRQLGVGSGRRLAHQRVGRDSLKVDWVPSSALFWGCAALILTYRAYVSEVFRSGIESVHPSQRSAARSLGLSHAQTMR